MKEQHFAHKKSLGQNFLEDEGLLLRLVEFSGLKEGETVLEIGAGMGALTKFLAEKAGRLISVELDSSLLGFIRLAAEKNKNFELINEDIMRLDIEGLFKEQERPRLIANLPYNITSELMEKLLLSSIDFKSISVMLQKEAALRIVAGPGDEGYCPLSILAKIKADFKGSIEVSRDMFTPKPKVDSLFINLEYKEAPLSNDELKGFYRFLKRCFLNKRKTLANNCMNYGNKSKAEIEEILLSLGKNRLTRSEEMSLEDFMQLKKALEN